MNTVAINNASVKAVAKGPITVDEIKDSLKKDKNGKPLKEAQIRQTYVKEYAAMKTSNEFKRSLFSNEDLGIGATEYEEERVTWIPVGKNHKVKDVEKALANVPDACIYKILSLEPIISSDQRRVLENGLTGDALENFLEENNIDGEEWTQECSKLLYDKIADAQLVVYGENNDQDKDADEPVLFNGKKQYRQVFFWDTFREDEDYRVEEKQDIPNLVLAKQEVEETVESK